MLHHSGIETIQGVLSKVSQSMSVMLTNACDTSQSGKILVRLSLSPSYSWCLRKGKRRILPYCTPPLFYVY